MKEIFHFWRYASNEELIDLFGTDDLDKIFEHSEEHILKIILDYLAES